MKQEQALEIISNDRRLVEIAKYERGVLLHIVDRALDKQQSTNRWKTYEELKSLASQIAGWHSDHPELATSQHYEALIRCIDQMLPQYIETALIDQDEFEDEYEDDEEYW